jgi:hypothetical protein
MYKLSIVDAEGGIIFNRTFIYQKDIIEFTKHKITYNDFKPRTHMKKYKTYKDYFILTKI